MSHNYTQIYSNRYLIDSSLIIGILNSNDQYNRDATDAFDVITSDSSSKLFISQFTLHESYTNLRYISDWKTANAVFLSWGLNSDIHVIEWQSKHEILTRKMLEQYRFLDLSFHDAYCACLALEFEIENILGFDNHFRQIGLEVFP